MGGAQELDGITGPTHDLKMETNHSHFLLIRSSSYRREELGEREFARSISDGSSNDSQFSQDSSNMAGEKSKALKGKIMGWGGSKSFRSSKSPLRKRSKEELFDDDKGQENQRPSSLKTKLARHQSLSRLANKLKHTLRASHERDPLVKSSMSSPQTSMVEQRLSRQSDNTAWSMMSDNPLFAAKTSAASE